MVAPWVGVPKRASFEFDQWALLVDWAAGAFVEFEQFDSNSVAVVA